MQVVIPWEASAYVRPADVPAHIDFTFAVMEINKAQVSAIAAAEAARRLEAEAARQKAEEQVRAICARPSVTLCGCSLLNLFAYRFQVCLCQ